LAKSSGNWFVGSWLAESCSHWCGNLKGFAGICMAHFVRITLITYPARRYDIISLWFESRSHKVDTIGGSVSIWQRLWYGSTSVRLDAQTEISSRYSFFQNDLSLSSRFWFPISNFFLARVLGLRTMNFSQNLPNWCRIGKCCISEKKPKASLRTSKRFQAFWKNERNLNLNLCSWNYFWIDFFFVARLLGLRPDVSLSWIICGIRNIHLLVSPHGPMNIDCDLDIQFTLNYFLTAWSTFNHPIWLNRNYITMPVTRKNAKRPASDPAQVPPAPKKVKQIATKAASKNASNNREKAKEAKKDEKGKPKPKPASQSKNGTSRNTKTSTKKTVAAPNSWGVNEPDIDELSATEYLFHALNFALLIASLWQSSWCPNCQMPWAY